MEGVDDRIEEVFAKWRAKANSDLIHASALDYPTVAKSLDEAGVDLNQYVPPHSRSHKVNTIVDIARSAVSAGLMDTDVFHKAIMQDKQNRGLSFLKLLGTIAKGKFGEDLTKAILCSPGDQWRKLSPNDVADAEWTPNGEKPPLLVEVKFSSSFDAFIFQQIRDPRNKYQDFEYDLLACIAMDRDALLRTWIIPAASIAAKIDAGLFPPQHGGNKPSKQSQTYWVRQDSSIAEFAIDYHECRDTAIELGSPSAKKRLASVTTPDLAA